MADTVTRGLLVRLRLGQYVGVYRRNDLRRTQVWRTPIRYDDNAHIGEQTDCGFGFVGDKENRGNRRRNSGGLVGFYNLHRLGARLVHNGTRRNYDFGVAANVKVL